MTQKKKKKKMRTTWIFNFILFLPSVPLTLQKDFCSPLSDCHYTFAQSERLITQRLKGAVFQLGAALVPLHRQSVSQVLLEWVCAEKNEKKLVPWSPVVQQGSFILSPKKGFSGPYQTTSLQVFQLFSTRNSKCSLLFLSCSSSSNDTIIFLPPPSVTPFVHNQAISYLICSCGVYY